MLNVSDDWILMYKPQNTSYRLYAKEICNGTLIKEVSEEKGEIKEKVSFVEGKYLDCEWELEEL